MTRIVLCLLAVVSVPALTGCNYGRIKAEREALMKQNTELQDKYSEALAALDACENEKAALMQQQAAQPAVVVEQQQAPAANSFAGIEGIDTYSSPGQVHVRVPGDVLFASGKVTLRDSAKKTLAQIASVLQREYPNHTIRVEGYTDTDPIKKSSWTDNLQLSLERAAAVHRYLQSQGVGADRMYAAGYGETRPRESKASSRRVEIVVLTE